jgi:hypothetical protein
MESAVRTCNVCGVVLKGTYVKSHGDEYLCVRCHRARKRKKQLFDRRGALFPLAFWIAAFVAVVVAVMGTMILVNRGRGEAGRRR